MVFCSDYFAYIITDFQEILLKYTKINQKPENNSKYFKM